MKKIEFTKVVASGNDFVVIHNCQLSVVSCQHLAKEICNRKFGVGADGLLVLEKSKVADVKMRIFNVDGSEAEMCGNGARCVALWAKSKIKNQKSKIIGIETKAGIIEALVSGSRVRIKLTEPKDYTLGVPIQIKGRELKISSINTGVPHAVIFVEGIEQIDVSNLGRHIRYYECFAPSGTNVDFVEVVDRNTIKVRTYERGVEDETLACGTGAAAAAVVTGYRLGVRGYENKINVITQGGETLRIYFKKDNDTISDVWLEGRARIVYKGEYYV